LVGNVAEARYKHCLQELQLAQTALWRGLNSYFINNQSSWVHIKWIVHYHYLSWINLLSDYRPEI